MEGAEAQEKHRVWRAIMVLVFFTVSDLVVQ